jgi:hypothetical protein
MNLRQVLQLTAIWVHSPELSIQTQRHLRARDVDYGSFAECDLSGFGHRPANTRAQDRCRECR